MMKALVCKIVQQDVMLAFFSHSRYDEGTGTYGTEGSA